MLKDFCQDVSANCSDHNRRAHHSCAPDDHQPDSLSPDEFDKVWADPKLRDTIKDRLRHPGGLHEWHLVSRADVFKRWGVTSEQIAEMRTLISETKFVNPTGKHGAKGSTKAHNELLEVIDSSTDYDMFRRRLQNWANYRLDGGIDALPDGLKP